MRRDKLREAQLKMLGILEEIDKLCRAHNISYWIEGGTLLGALRHGGFIPWDDDVDISMLRSDYDRVSARCAISIRSSPMVVMTLVPTIKRASSWMSFLMTKLPPSCAGKWAMWPMASR